MWSNHSIGPRFKTGSEIHGTNLARYTAPCECASCRQQFVPPELQKAFCHKYENMVRPQEAEVSLAKFVSQINIDRAHLAELCSIFGNTILSRWRKKSRDKREALLIQADPTMEKKAWYRLRFDAEEISGPTARQQHRNNWLLPYMSVEIMKSSPNILFGLVQNRIQYSPQEWAASDSNTVKQGFATGYLGMEYCGHSCVVMHGLDYGELVPWNKEAAERWDIVGYPRARLVIEAQAVILSRLRSIVELILGGVHPDSLEASDRWQETVQAGFKQTSNVEMWSEYVNQPFSSPQRFDVEHYCSVSQARMQAAQDHLWLLQTDPSYTCSRWRILYEEWSHMKDLCDHFRDNVHPAQPLPRQVEHSLALLEAALVQYMDKTIRHFTAWISQSPGFKDNYKVTLHWIVFQCTGDTDNDKRLDHPELFAKLEAYLAEADEKERDRLDETVYARPSEFAALHEMLLAVRSHRPSFFRRDEQGLSDLRKTNSTAYTRGLALEGAAEEAVCFPWKSLETFDQTQPAAGRRDEAWLEKRTMERKFLTRFWDQALEALRGMMTYTRMEPREIEDTISLISVSRSSEYQKLVESERLEVLEAIKSATVTQIPTRSTLWDQGPDISKLVIEERAPKPKTRPSGPINEPIAPEPIEDTPSTQPIPTTPRALEVLKKMFPTTAEETAAKTTDWDLFVHAMNDLNFAARNSGGSAVAFEHASKRKIIFHRPHPVAKIDSVMLQSMGKRMKKHFEWCRERFVET
ncbi:hypothetical protein AUEXF2481DRAFT_33212 [Aureobasidium subglaciale EXF-2481]|uniref:Clr5 domain-containing protein n=1 Tax=Aureobasidium subglaciale (strain EXF-2481) TaxID=1043005 RepID=A0A074YWL6_AURSE|nr:uncharacterized protein AUEXF2481DRAFT_33212 [Aureobasidium subglaciale EXF-2481]KAI5198507.1 hypothetical protein E4T38_07461 [Aureobasidium subglaciale]KAI5217301.1 hypothetical protein E4T40_07472 [Aureobasidium subglaciale]KAI5220931.1 hypothetical protein E4T41_07313 [Aureobasidium subglaciale]KAI5258493.1 hypothetical protein E4T46_07290 [Aureobasidium subglaciale]KEQ91261.1 hypothetical protein AUEXF2481DRAFT_33212 [Aureobasidium subglaciale EXF-2481]